MKNGFTLVELSIVLVIIGLLTAGVLVAQSLIESARVGAQIREIQQFDVALNNFYVNYKCIPGDCPHDFTGQGNVGNNNKILQDVGNATPPNIYWDENYLYFPQLAGSKHLSKEYIHVACHFVPGENFPELKNGNGGIGITGNTRGELFYLLALTVNSTEICVSHVNGNMYDIISGGVFSPAEALSLDIKSDDGIYNDGSTVAIVNSGVSNAALVNSTDGGSPYPHNIAATDDNCITASGQYNVEDSDNLCSLMIKAEFYR